MNEWITIAINFINEGWQGKTALSFIAVWILGKFSTSTPYKKLREWLGKSAEAAGVFIDGTLGSKLGRPIWNPLEKFLTDTLGFMVEQFLNGLRKNDLIAMAEQVERLEDVGSVARVKAIKANMEQAIASADTLPKNPILDKILETSYANSLRDKLEGP